MPSRKRIEDSLTRQGMWNIKGLHRKGRKGRKGKSTFFWESTQTSLDSEKEHAPHFEQQHRNTCHSGQFHRESMCSKAKPAHIPHNMLGEIKVQIARRHQGSTPFRTRVHESA